MPPFPPYKEMPHELSQRYDSREVVVYAIINSEGRFEQLAVKENPRVELNAPILQALRNGPSAPRKSAANLWLLGITLAAQLVKSKEFATTLAAFRAGGFEVNPLVASLTIHFGRVGGVVLSKLIAVLLMLGVRRRLWMVNLFYIGVIFWNVVVVLSLVLRRH